MITLYRPKHRRVIITDLTGPPTPVADVTNEARCSHFGERFCMGICPRHRPEDYAECMARHATDSIDSAIFSAVTGERCD